jgi:deazaflavin-dependent oxidoreductase (nitroreductase family)
MSRPISDATPVAPSALVRTVMRPMVKVLNPLIRKLAGKRFMSMAALLRHTGRRSGRQYSTPVGAHVRGDDCLVPLTFGSESDWSKNLREAGGGTMRWKGRDFEITGPELHRAEDIKPLVKKLFSPPERLGFRMLGIKGFLYLHALPLPNGSIQTP